MKVSEFCNRTVIVAEARESIAEVARLMRDHHVGCVVIVEGRAGSRTPIGIVTDRDVAIDVVAEGRDASKTAVGEIMSPVVYSAREPQELEDVLREMRALGLRRALVVDRQGVLQGIFTFDDLVEWTAGHMLELSRLVRRELDREHDRAGA